MNFESSMVRCQEKADFGKGHKKVGKADFGNQSFGKNFLISEYVLNPESFAFTTQNAP